MVPLRSYPMLATTLAAAGFVVWMLSFNLSHSDLSNHDRLTIPATAASASAPAQGRRRGVLG